MSDTKKVRRLVVDPETGEQTNEIYIGDSILRAKTTQYLKETVEIGKGEKFIKLFESTISALGDESLTGNEWKVLTTIIKYFRHDSGLVSFNNGKPLSIENICELSNISESTAFRAIDKLVSSSTAERQAAQDEVAERWGDIYYKSWEIERKRKKKSFK